MVYRFVVPAISLFPDFDIFALLIIMMLIRTVGSGLLYVLLPRSRIKEESQLNAMARLLWYIRLLNGNLHC